MKENPQATAARTLLDYAKLPIEIIDEHCWRVEGYLFWPATGLWRRPDGSAGGGGAGKLIADLRRNSGRWPPAAASA